MPEPVASVDVGTIRQRFNFDWAMDPDSVEGVDTYWWWARSIRVDPNEVIADDDEGNLWSIPFTTDGADSVTFSDPVRVRETFVPVGAGDGAAATATVSRRRQRNLAAALERPVKPTDESHPSHPAASEPHDHKEDQVPIDLDALRTRLGLSEDANEEQINDALQTEPEEPAAGVPEDEVQQRIETAVAAAREEDRQRNAAASAHGVTIDKDALTQLQDDAAAGRAARDQQTAAERDTYLASAVTKGKFPPVAKAGYAAQLAKGGEIEKQTREFIDGLPDNTIPVSERGVATATDDTTTNGQGTGWFPKLEKQEG